MRTYDVTDYLESPFLLCRRKTKTMHIYVKLFKGNDFQVAVSVK